MKENDRHAHQGRPGPIPYENKQIHNRWHPDIPMAVWVKPGDDFVLETYDWTGGAIKNDDSADDVRDVDLSTVHFLSGPVGGGRRTRRPAGGGPAGHRRQARQPVGLQRLLQPQQWRRLLTDHFPHAQKSIWDFHGMFTSSRHVPGEFRRPDPSRPDRLPARQKLDDWNKREQALIDTNPNRVPPLANPPAPKTRTWARCRAPTAIARRPRARDGAARARRQLRYQDLARRARVLPGLRQGRRPVGGRPALSQGDGEITFCGAIEMAGSTCACR